MIVVGLAGLATPLSPVLADDPVVTFPDAKLDVAIREAIGKPTGDIYQSDLEGLASLNASNKSISDITGLQYCVNITTLDLSYNEISDISPLSSLTNLTTLHLRGVVLRGVVSIDIQTQILYMRRLSPLTNLVRVRLCANGISDISPLSSLTNLTTLDLYGNSISDISPLSSLTNLTTLDLSRNRISNISSLSSLTNLTTLDLHDNRISNISSLSSLTNLTTLYLYDNRISNISSLSSLANLTTLSLSRNRISNISPLTSLTSLTALRLGYNRISDISPLAHNIGLDEGDTVHLQYNCLDITADSQARNDIQTLLDRGVSVSYSRQKRIPLIPLLIGAIIAAAVAAGLAIFFVRRRRPA